MTFLHHAEHLVDVPGKRIVRFQVPVLRDGCRTWLWMEEFDTSEPCHPAWPTDLFGRVVDAYIEEAGPLDGRIGNAGCALLDAAPLLTFAIQRMTDLATRRAPDDVGAG